MKFSRVNKKRDGSMQVLAHPMLAIKRRNAKPKAEEVWDGVDESDHNDDKGLKAWRMSFPCFWWKRSSL